VLGTTDPEYLALANEPEAVLAKARDQEHLTVLAHPFRWDGAASLLDAVPPPDALEYYTCNQNGSQAGKSRGASARLDLPLLNAGDVHTLRFIDQFWIETTRPIEHACDIRRIVLERAYRNCPDDV